VRKIRLQITETPLEMFHQLHDLLNDLDYRITGLTAVNLYGYGMSTNVFDIAVASDEAVYEAVKILGLPKESEFGSYDPYIWKHDFGDKSFYIKIQGDLMGDAYIHPLGFKLHSKELLIKRLEIYSDYDSRVLKALAFIALTLDDEKTKKYKYYWNRL
jgi:hypothetical protein